MTRPFFVAALAALTLLAAPLFPQLNNASLGGLITDATGGVIRKAEVSVQSTDTGARRAVHTDDAGRYLFEQLTSGEYRLTVQLTGFQTETATGIRLDVGQAATVDLRLRPGELKTEVLVTGAAALVETRDSALSAVMENTGIRELPLNGRDVAQLALLQPGVASSVGVRSEYRGF